MRAAARLRPDLYPRQPELPPAFEYLWGVYRALRMAAPRSDFGAVRPISFRDVLDYTQVTGERLKPFEVKLVRLIDEIAIAGRG